MKNEARLDPDWDRLREMRDKTEEIERLVIELQELGRGVPVVQKNVRAILSLTYVLKFGISEVAEITEQEGGE